MNWIPHPVFLTGRYVRLEPLDNRHFPALLEIGAQPVIWTHLPFDGASRDKLLIELQSAILKRTIGEQYPFTTIEQATNRVIGCTRLFDLYPRHRRLEIGWTWYDPAVWGRGLNTECKLLLLEFCFEILGVNRVQFKTRESNQRSQAAILKIGATFEGVLRKDRVMPDGQVRDTWVYSVLDDEWPGVKLMLQQRVAQLAAVQQGS
jgi:RimJ/RimL family protein N-acetyltransferase